jgi:hypothetical protein
MNPSSPHPNFNHIVCIYIVCLVLCCQPRKKETSKLNHEYHLLSNTLLLSVLIREQVPRFRPFLCANFHPSLALEIINKVTMQIFMVPLSAITERKRSGRRRREETLSYGKLCLVFEFRRISSSKLELFPHASMLYVIWQLQSWQMCKCQYSMIH